MFLIFAFGCITLTPLADKYGRWPVISWCLPAVTLSLALTINPSSLLILYLALVLFALVYIVRGSVIYPFTLEFAPDCEKIERMMAFNVVEGLVIIASALLLKYSQDVSLFIALSTAFVAIVSLLFFWRSEESPEFYLQTGNSAQLKRCLSRIQKLNGEENEQKID